MKPITFTAGVAILVSALAIPALAQDNEMQLSMPAGNAHQSGAERTGQLRGDLPAHVTVPPQLSASQNQTPVGQRAGEQAASDPAIPGQLLDRRKMRGATGAASSP